jgi:hypothetical protein
MEDSSKQIILALLVLAVAYLLMTDKKESFEVKESEKEVSFFDEQENEEDEEDEEDEATETKPVSSMQSNLSVTPFTNKQEVMSLNAQNDAKIELGKCGGQNGQFLSSNLLPNSDSVDEDFAEFSPANLQGKNFIDSAKFLIGTQSQSLRNANYQLRSEPANPQDDVCAWNNTTIMPEQRRALDIGTKAF